MRLPHTTDTIRANHQWIRLMKPLSFLLLAMAATDVFPGDRPVGRSFATRSEIVAQKKNAQKMSGGLHAFIIPEWG